MQIKTNWHWLTVLPGLAIGQGHAAPIEGESGSNAAALLVLLGIWALLMGMRNLRELRHKRLVLNRDPQSTSANHPENPRSTTQN